MHKVRSTPDEPERATAAGLTQLCERGGLRPSDVDTVFHGTTVATNAVLEHDGAVAGLVTTSGFRDIVHIGRHQRPQHYSVMQDIPWQARPFVKRRHRKVVAERIVPPAGDVLEPLDEEGVRRVARELREEGVEAVAVCFLFSYLNPEHERRAAQIVARGDPRRVRDRERGHLPAVPRVRALHDCLHERVRRAEDRPLPRAPRGGGRGARRPRRAPRDDVQRWRRERPGGGGEAGHPAPVGPGRRRSRRLVGRAAVRPRAPDHVRHGRNVRRHRTW